VVREQVVELDVARRLVRQAVRGQELARDLLVLDAGRREACEQGAGEGEEAHVGSDVTMRDAVPNRMSVQN
jgi:hypothetical protein